MRKPNCPMWLSMIQLRWRVGSKLDLALDDFHPWQNAHAASFDLGSSALAPIRSNRVILGAASVHAYSARGSHEICRRERISVPAKIARQPFYHLEPAGPMRALEPAGRHLADAPAEPVTFHQELDAITESAIGLDCDLVNHSAREQPKAVAGVVRRQTGDMVKGEIGGAHQCGLQPGAADHAATGHKAAGTDDVATLCRRCHHRIDDASVIIIVRRRHDGIGRFAVRKAGHYCTVSTAPAVAYEYDSKSHQCRAIVLDR